jgi:predicted MFS family arabinose efflux permease
MNPWRGLAGLPREVWLLCACTLVNRLGTMALPFLVLYLTQGRAWRPEQAAWALMVYGLGALLTGPLAGWAADRFGHLRVMRMSLWSSGALLVLLPFIQPPWLFHPTVFLWAACTQAFGPSSMALLAGLAGPGQRRPVFSLQRLAVNLGMSVGPALGGVVAHVSYTLVFWVDGLTTVASATLLGRLLPAAPPSGTAGGAPRQPARAWHDLRLLLLLAAFLLVLAAFTQIEGALPLWVVRELGLGDAFFGLLFTVNTAVIVLAEVPLNLRMARWNQGRAMLLGALCYAAGYGLTGFATTRAALLATVVVWSFGEIILLPVMGDVVTLLAPPERRGEYLGLYSAAFAGAFTLWPWLGVLAYARAGPGWVWTGCGALALLGGLALGRLGAAGRLGPLGDAAGPDGAG